MRPSTSRPVDANADEARLRTVLRDAPSSTLMHQLAHAELADLLHEQGRLDEARELYTNALLVRPPSPEAAEQRRLEVGEKKEARQVSPSRPTSGSEAEEWEDGEWDVDFDRLTLVAKPKAPQGQRVPNRRRPSLAIFAPAAQQNAIAARKAAAEAAAAAAASAAARAADSQASVQEAAALNGVADSKGDVAEGPSKATPQKRAVRSQLARLDRVKAHDDAPRGLDPPGLRDALEPAHVPWEGRHVLEIVGVRETDGDSALFEYLQGVQEFPIQPLLRWADDSHALVVFSDVADAKLALEKAPEIGRLWLRPYDQASPQCRQIRPSELRPPTSRPKTTAVVARRLLGNALQNRDLIDLAGEKKMRADRKEKTAEKERRQKALDDAWGE